AEAELMWAGRRLGLGLAALYDGRHAQAIGAGEAVWSRLGLAAGLAWRPGPGGAGLVGGHGALGGGGGVIGGRADPATRATRTVDSTAAAGVRIGRRWPWSAVWIEGTARAFLRSQGVYVRGSGEAADLPRWEAGVSIGGSFGPGVTSARDPT